MKSNFIEQARCVAEQYRDDIQGIEELGNGNINTTFVVYTGDKPFILQRINPVVFPDPGAVARNSLRLSRHFVKQEENRSGSPYFATVLATRAGDFWWRDAADAVWRAQSFIDGAPLRRISSPCQAGEIGRLLAHFHRLAANIAGDALEVPLPGFHVLPGYFEEFDRVRQGLGKRDFSSQVQACFAMIEKFRPQASLFQLACERGLLSVRTIHGDPKSENFLFDKTGRRAVGLIDLDTVGPGFLHHDLGDCLRSCCNRGGENGDSRTVRYDLEICRAFYQGYRAEMAERFNRDDSAYIFEAVLLITFELGLRFFTDHLRGDTYFRVRRAGENLDKALVQFALVDCIVEQEKQLRAIFSCE